ncbi:MAG TPA: hypothetical protein PLK34_02995 [Candidatus Pacearchaeota archaeon]|nr:hypothetical protein [Candidatus Pacearchaeota archaeon]
MKKGDVRGVSPNVATIILVIIILVIALIVFLWIRGLIGESIIKFDGRSVERACETVDFSVSYSEGNLAVINNGDIPIYDLNVKVVRRGSSETDKFSEIFKGSSTPFDSTKLKMGGSFLGILPEGYTTGATSLIFTPILMGKGANSGTQKTSACNEKFAKTVKL